MRFVNAGSYNAWQSQAGFVPPYIFEGGKAKTGNGGVVPPHVPGSTPLPPDYHPRPGRDTYPQPDGNGGYLPAPNGNGGVVPPHILEKLEQEKANVPPPPTVDCFPELPVKKDAHGVDVIFVDVQLPVAKKPLVNLRGGDDCFPHLPSRKDACGIDVFAVDVVLPGQVQAYAGKKLSN